MRKYPDQPSISTDQFGSSTDNVKDLTRFIIDFLSEELPDCPTNEWFIESVHLANMADKLVEELQRE